MKSVKMIHAKCFFIVSTQLFPGGCKIVMKINLVQFIINVINMIQKRFCRRPEGLFQKLRHQQIIYQLVERTAKSGIVINPAVSDGSIIIKNTLRKTRNIDWSRVETNIVSVFVQLIIQIRFLPCLLLIFMKRQGGIIFASCHKKG